MKVIAETAPNVITVMKSSISRNVKLPLSRIRGSEEFRYKKAQEFSNILLNKLEQVSGENVCLVKNFNNIINEILYPDKIEVTIKHKERVHDSNYTVVVGALSIVTEDYIQRKVIGKTRIEYHDSQVSSYKIKLPLDKTEQVILNKYIALHEARHLFDHICNPKLSDERILGINLFENKKNAFDGVYKCLLGVNRFQISECFIKQKVKNYLSKLSEEDCINCLQFIRRILQSEINAYKDELSYLKKNFNKNISRIIDSYKILHNYPRRLAIVNQMLRDKLAEAREKIHKNNSVKNTGC